MGVDIPDVQRVIQWGVPNFINLSTVWQRMGRAGRSRDTQAVFTLWLQKSMRIKTNNDTLAIYRSPIKENDPASKAIMSSIVEFEEKVDQMAARFGSNVLTDFDCEEALTVMDNLDASAGDEVVSIPRDTRDPRLRFDRGILALGSNTGCYRALFLRYFNSEPQPLISQDYCCSNCTSQGIILDRIKELLSLETDDTGDPNLNSDNLSPPDLGDLGDLDDNAEDDIEDGDERTPSSVRGPRKRTPYYIALVALPQLHAFRMKISMEHSEHYGDTILSFDEIRKICKSICGITEAQDFCRYLKTRDYFHLAPIAPYIPELLALCQQISTTTPRPPPRRTQIVSNQTTIPQTRHRQASIAPLPYQSQPSLPLIETPETLSVNANPTTTSTSDLLPLIPDTSSTTMPSPMPPPMPPPKSKGAKTYDPQKRREYYLKAKARKQSEDSSILRNITNEALVSSSSTPKSTKRGRNLAVDQENIPPSKVPRIC